MHHVLRVCFRLTLAVSWGRAAVRCFRTAGPTAVASPTLWVLSDAPTSGPHSRAPPSTQPPHHGPPLPRTPTSPSAGAPALLPEFLQPSIPTKSNAAWKNAEQRAAERAAKVAKAAGLPQLPPVPVRWVRVPDGGPPGVGPADGEGPSGSGEQGGQEGGGDGGAPLPTVVALPAVLPPGQEERQLCGLEVYFPAPEDASLGGLASPPKRKPWTSRGGAAKRPLLLDDDGLPLPPPPPAARQGYAPHSQEARDAKSGKGKRRLFLHPVIRSRERCGKCSVSGGPRWAEGRVGSGEGWSESIDARGARSARRVSISPPQACFNPHWTKACDLTCRPHGGLVVDKTGCHATPPCRRPASTRTEKRRATRIVSFVVDSWLTRLFVAPIMLQACLNPHWKKACMTRRAELEEAGVVRPRPADPDFD